MDDSKEDGGAAFPGQALGSDGRPMSEHWNGLSLRDYFAAAALTGMLDFTGVASYEMDRTYADVAARTAYTLADAMLEARKPKD